MNLVSVVFVSGSMLISTMSEAYLIPFKATETEVYKLLVSHALCIPGLLELEQKTTCPELNVSGVSRGGCVGCSSTPLAVN